MIHDNGYSTKTFSQVVSGSSNGWTENNDSDSNNNDGNNNASQQGSGHRPVYNEYLAYFIRTYLAENGASGLPEHSNEANYNNNFLLGAYPIEYLYAFETTHTTHDVQVLNANNEYSVVTVDDGPISHWQDLTDGQKVWLIQTFDHIQSTSDVDKLSESLMAGGSE
jgi:hypothetical protein